ncbi:MAG: response regulator [Clostridia bacterium]
MFKIMIVDDEPAIRKGLTSFIDWESFGCKISAVATDGVDAMEKLEKAEPDIVITDIKMPEMDGIELSKYIYNRHPHIKTIILTAYDDFDYSQSAIKYGVVDFVLKLTSTAKIIEAIEKAKTIIIKERESAARIKELEGELSEQIKEVQEHLILHLIKRIETDQDKILKRMDLLNIKLTHYCVAALTVDDDNTSSRPHSSIRSLNNLVSSMLTDYRHYIATVSINQLCLFIDLKSPIDYTDSIPKIFSIFSEMVYIMDNLEKTGVNIGISSNHDRIDEAADAYNEAILALTDRFYNIAKVHIYSGRIDDSLDSSTMKLQKHFDAIIEHAKSGMFTETTSMLSDMFETFKSIHVPIETIKSISLQLLVAIDRLTPNDMHLDIFISSSSNDRYLGIWNSKSAADIHEILETSITDAIVSASNYTLTNNTIVKKVEKYILNHYSGDINLTIIAEHVHMNGSYLSRLYKKETGININEKISYIRIEKAKELLNSTDLKVYEVAEQVGIKNPTYFSILFKKCTGLYPNNYKSCRASKS